MDLASKIIAVLLTIVLGLLANESRRLLNEVRQISRRQDAAERRQRKFVRTIFNLLAKLYPERAETITDQAQEFYMSDKDLSEEAVLERRRWAD